jgi:hypothetical protein
MPYYNIMQYKKVDLMRNLFCILFVTLHINTSSCQDLFRISLEDGSVANKGINFSIAEILDSRSDKNVVGIIQRGLNNRKDLALFQTPGLSEVEKLLRKSELIDEQKGLTLRISKLSVSEVTQAFKEIARADVSIDLFLQYQNKYYYLRSAYATMEQAAIDVTRTHSENIVTCIEKALIQLSSGDKKLESEESFSKEQLLDPKLSFRTSRVMPIYSATQYTDGYYATFDEFLNNTPSISLRCKVTLGNDPRVKCADKEEAISPYGYAEKNNIYILFNQEFFLLEKHDNQFLFHGPREFSSKDIEGYAKSGIVPNSIGRRAGHSTTYVIDPSSGSITSKNGL